MRGLTWAFLLSGARSVLASEWKVSDASTTASMTRFYRELRAGQARDVALQRAQVAVLQDREHGWSHPYFWAAFGLQGDYR